ncbi:3-isopropylmalate dehydratase small subunit [Termitidicoccus mucosus]|uniref:3-isopropylmalate dehydratase n=1 Tax=Termitidicoccus mucosus TaxID=1184151 RepID=A0A178IGS9_9BACT|nr:isopropylmalate isomerase [Opitutaceae bacterium TSB47]
MALAKITQIAGRGVYVPGNDIDTDRIIPARFMKCVTFDGLGEYLFFDVRHTPDGKPVVPAHPIDRPEHKGATILLSGANFGCGSSREHAPQAIHKAGFRAVIAENFAEIFFGNSTTLGIPCVNAKREDIAKVAAAIAANPQLEITVDVEKLEVRFGDQKIPVTQRESARDALVHGRWDAIGELMEGREAVLALREKLPYLAA